MSETPAHHTAEISQKTNKISKIWFIPLLAVGIGVWMLYQYVVNIGVDIQLTMRDASGIEAGKTAIKARNVKVGVVTDVTLSEDYQSAIITARIDKDATRMLREDTQFWLVEPRIGTEGISGLDTLLSGVYFEIQPGKSAEDGRQFNVLAAPPVAPVDAKGLQVILTNIDAGKLSVGDPVMYKGVVAGRVEKVTFDIEQQQAKYQLFVFEPYDNLITMNTRFWLNSGIDFKVGAEGFNIRVDSLETLITGGVTFGVQENEVLGQLVTEPMTEFALYDNQQDVKDGLYEIYLEYVMLFDESIRGLAEGAPVEYRGLRIGTVARVPFEKPSVADGLTAGKIPVLIKIEPRRLFSTVTAQSLELLTTSFEQEFQKGLTGSLKTGNLLTGSRYIELDYAKDHRFVAQIYHDYPVFPTKEGEFAELQKQLIGILNKVDDMPLEQTFANLNASLKQLENTLASAAGTMDSVTSLVDAPATQAIPKELNQSIAQLEKTLASYDQNSALYLELQQTLRDFERTLVELQPVLEQINEKPNSLIFGAEQVDDPVPVKGK